MSCTIGGIIGEPVHLNDFYSMLNTVSRCCSQPHGCVEGVAVDRTSVVDGESENPNRCVATITKKWNGWVNSGVLDVAAFIIDFEPSISISVEERALIFSAAFLIDLMYYENGGSVYFSRSMSVFDELPEFDVFT